MFILTSIELDFIQFVGALGTNVSLKISLYLINASFESEGWNTVP